MSEVIPPPPPLPEDAPEPPPAPTATTPYTKDQIRTLETNLKLMEHEMKAKEHELEARKFEFERHKWRQEQLLKEREWDHERHEEWRSRVAGATHAAYLHRHHMVDKAIWLYLGSLSERSGAGRPSNVTQVLDEFWSVYGTLQNLIVRAPFEGTDDSYLTHDPLVQPAVDADADEHF